MRETDNRDFIAVIAAQDAALECLRREMIEQRTKYEQRIKELEMQKKALHDQLLERQLRDLRHNAHLGATEP